MPQRMVDVPDPIDVSPEGADERVDDIPQGVLDEPGFIPTVLLDDAPGCFPGGCLIIPADEDAPRRAPTVDIIWG